MSDAIRVAAAVIQRGGKILACRRRADQDHGGKWEFPVTLSAVSESWTR